MPKKFLIINSAAPYSTANAQEALDFILACAALEQPVSILFTGNGVWQLLKQQHPQAIGLKNFTAAFKSLPLYDIQSIYVEKQALQERSLNPDELMLKITMLDAAQITQLIAEHEIVVNF